MRILITNDDGINAPGLIVLQAIAEEVAGDGGEVWTVAPAFEQSGVAHCISYTHPFMMAELAPQRFAAEGSPADCVLAGIYDVFDGQRPDLVLSGVNRGNNAGENTLYSGTIGAAIEASLQGVNAIALSQFYGPGNVKLRDPFEAAVRHGAKVVRDILALGEWGTGEYGVFYNVNFPPIPAAQVRGVRVTAQGNRVGTHHRVDPHMSPSGRKFLWIGGGPQDVKTAPGTDVRANLEGFVSVTPMRCDLTAHDLVASVRDRLE